MQNDLNWNIVNTNFLLSDNIFNSLLYIFLDSWCIIFSSVVLTKHYFLLSDYNSAIYSKNTWKILSLR